MTVLEGATRWKFVVQTSRTFLNQNFRDQTGGKTQFKGRHFRVNPKKINEYSNVSVRFFVFFFVGDCKGAS